MYVRVWGGGGGGGGGKRGFVKFFFSFSWFYMI